MFNTKKKEATQKKTMGLNHCFFSRLRMTLHLLGLKAKCFSGRYFALHLRTKKKESEGNRHLDILRVLQSHLYHFLKNKKKESPQVYMISTCRA